MPHKCLPMKPVVVLFFVAAVMFFLAGPVRGNTFTVTTTGDSGAGSLRQAITDANNNPGSDTIVFQLTGTKPFTISLAGALPVVSTTMTIDGTTQAGYSNAPVVELNGAGAGSGAVGLQLDPGASGSTVLGLAINRFNGPGLLLNGSANVIQGNFIGTDITGTVTRGNGGYGIDVKSAGNQIGGTNSGNGNVISGNGSSGVSLDGAAASGNVIQGNLLGTDISGSVAMGNGGDGVSVLNAPGNTLGTGNVISGNNLSGLSLSGGSATGNVVLGNFIGTDATGKLALGNHYDGIYLTNTVGNTIGGTSGGAGNVISGNLQNGIVFTGGAGNNSVQGNLIGLASGGTNALANKIEGVLISGASANTIGGASAAARNVISGNGTNGVVIAQTGDNFNVIAGNYIGTDITGRIALGNLWNGVLIQGGTNTVGGQNLGKATNRNIISGNGQVGVWLAGINGSGAGNLILGNFIGLDATGANSLGNTNAGIFINGASANQIGGTSASVRNVISANGNNGILISGSGTSSNVVQGNYIGTDQTGTAARGNTSDAVSIQGANANLIGGSATGAGNVLSGNIANVNDIGNDGVYLLNASFNIIQGNLIGTDVTGNLALGNSWNGIHLDTASSNQIGGAVSGAGNLISANGREGIWMDTASWNIIQGNNIGTQADGSSALGNTQHGIDLRAGSTNNTVGGVAAGNHIAHAQSIYAGVRVRTSARNNLISGNSIFNNGALGIDLDLPNGTAAPGTNAIVHLESGVAANAANRGQNYPCITNAVSGTGTLIRGWFDSALNKTYALEFFASPTGNASGCGEGQVFLGQTNLVLGTICPTNFAFVLPATVPAGWVVTATATDPANNTSEFSTWLPAITVPNLQLLPSTDSKLSVAWTNSGGSFSLLWSTNLNPPVVWTTSGRNPTLSNGMYSVLVSPTNPAVFYRLTPK